MVNAAASSNPQVARLVRRRGVALRLAAGVVISLVCLTVAERAPADGVSGPAPASRAAPLAATLGMTISLHVEYG